MQVRKRQVASYGSPGPPFGSRYIAQVDVHAAVGFGLSELPEPRGGGRLQLHGGNRQAQDFDELRQIPGI